MGCCATFAKLANTMNVQSGAPGEHRPVLLLSQKQLASWFRLHSGQEISALEKPLLADDYKIQGLDGFSNIIKNYRILMYHLPLWT